MVGLAGPRKDDRRGFVGFDELDDDGVGCVDAGTGQDGYGDDGDTVASGGIEALGSDASRKPRADLCGLTTPLPRLARHATEGVTIMATHNGLTDPSAGSSSVGKRSRWVYEHGLLAYTLIA